jgi:hypothetical protein
LHEKDLLAAYAFEKLHRHIVVRIPVHHAAAKLSPSAQAISLASAELAVPMKIVNSLVTPDHVCLCPDG